MKEDLFQPIEVQRGSDLIVESIWDCIRSGRLKPGDKLPPERDLIRQFGVSKTLLREALSRLEAYGHIVKKRGAHGGSFILDHNSIKGVDLVVDYLDSRSPTRAHLSPIMQALVPILVRSACDSLDEDGEERLRQLIERFRYDLGQHGGSVEGWRFNLLLAEISGNPILDVITQILVRTIMQIEFSEKIGDIGSSPLEKRYSELAFHAISQAIDAIVARDPERAILVLAGLGRDLRKILSEV